MEVTEFEIDEGNEPKFAAHGVSVREVIQVLEDDFRVFRNKKSGSGRPPPRRANARRPAIDTSDRLDGGRGSVAPNHGLGLQPGGKDEVRAMTEQEFQPTENADDLEEVPIKRGTTRGAVVSVRLNTSEAQDLADAAERAGMSISQFARNAIRSAIHTEWQLRVWSSRSIVRVSQATGGSFGRLFWPAMAGEQRVVFWELAPEADASRPRSEATSIA